MEIKIAINYPGNVDGGDAEVSALEQFKAIHAELLGTVKSQYDNLLEILTKAVALCDKPEDLVLEDMPDFLSGLYGALLSLKLYTSILFDVLDDSDVPDDEGYDELLKELYELIDVAEAFLEGADEAYDVALFGEDDDDLYCDDCPHQDGCPCADGGDTEPDDEGEDPADGAVVEVTIESELGEDFLSERLNTPEVKAAMQALVNAIFANLP